MAPSRFRRLLPPLVWPIGLAAVIWWMFGSGQRPPVPERDARAERPSEQTTSVRRESPVRAVELTMGRRINLAIPLAVIVGAALIVGIRSVSRGRAGKDG